MQIDELVVSLVLDTGGFAKGQKDATAAAQKGAADIADAAGKGEKASNDAAAAIVAGLNRLAAAMEKGGDSAERQAKRQAEGNKKVAASFEGAIRTGLTFLAVLAGARTIEQFTARITALDAALGRTAYGMGQTPQALSAIGKAVQRAGGDFNGAVGGLKSLSDAYQDFRLTGTSALIEPMTRLQALSGKTVSFGRDTLANFESIADALQALDLKGEHALADRLGRQILGSDDLTNLAKRGSGAVRAEIAESERHGVIDPKDAKAAQDLQHAYEGLSQSVVGLGTKIETALSPYLTKLLKQLDDLIDKHGAEWVTEFSAYLDKHKPDIEAFGKAVGDLATSAGTIAAAFASQSPMVVALEAFGGLLTLRLLNPLNLVLAALRAFSAFPVTGLLARLLGTPGGMLAGTMLGAGAAAGAMNVPNADEYGRDAGTWGGDAPDNGPLGAHLRHRKAHTPHTALRRLYDWGRSKLGLGGDEKPEGGEHAQGAHLGQRRARGGGAPDTSLPPGPVPGANGRGLTNAYWRGPLDNRGEGGKLGPREMFDYLKSNGASDNEALLLTGAASSESSFNPDAKHDPAYPGGPPTGHGLFGHKDTRLDMRGKNWQQQSMLALHELRNRSVRGVGNLGEMLARARTPEEIADVEMHYEAPAGYKVYNPRAGDNYMGRLNSIRRFSAMAGRASPSSAAAPPPAAPPAPIGDQAAFDAEKRLREGRGTDADRELTRRHREQENAPQPYHSRDDDRTSRSRAGDAPVKVGQAAHRLLHLLHQAQRLGTHDGKPVAVTMDDKGLHGIERRTFGRYLDFAKKHSDEMPMARRPDLHAAWHGHPGAMDYHRGLMQGAQMAAYHHHAVTNNIDRSSTSETKIGSLTVHTQARDGQEVADALDGIYQRAAAAGRRNYGQA